MKMVWLWLVGCLFADLGAPFKLPAQENPVANSNGRIAVRALKLPLSQVLEEFTQATSIPFVISPQIARDMLTVEMTDLNVDDAVRRLLSRYDAFYLYSASDNGAEGLQVVWVYPKGYGKRIRPVPPEEWASTKEMEQALLDSDPAVRAPAYETLIRRKRRESKDLVVAALKNESVEAIRLRVFYAARESGVQLPPDLVQSLAISDSSDQMRVMALEALENNEAIRGLLTSALTDPSLLVQTKAKELLNDLDAAVAERLPKINDK